MARKAPLTNLTTTELVVGGLVASAAIGIAYYLWSQSQSSETAGGGSAGGSSSITSSEQGTVLGPGGSSTSVGGASSGEGVAPFNPNAPSTPGPVGPTINPLPVV